MRFQRSIECLLHHSPSNFSIHIHKDILSPLPIRWAIRETNNIISLEGIYNQFSVVPTETGGLRILNNTNQQLVFLSPTLQHLESSGRENDSQKLQ